MWIKCSDRLPEKYVCVLIYNIVDENYYLASLENGYWDDTLRWQYFIEGYCEVEKVSYWMPIPELPKENDC